VKKFRWDKKYLYWGITAFLVVVFSITFFLMLNKIESVKNGLGFIAKVFAPIIYGFAIAYLVNQLLKPLEKHVFKGLGKKLFPKNNKLATDSSRIMAIILSEAIVIAIVLGLLVIMLPQIFNSIVELVNKSQTYAEICVAWVGDFLDGKDVLEPVVLKWLENFSEYITNWIKTDILPQITTIIAGITGGVISMIKVTVNIALGVVISIYMLYNKETFCAQAKKLVYGFFEAKNANRLMDELSIINKAFGDYVAGTLLDALIIGVTNYIFMLLLGMPYGALISIIVAVTNLIPMFGPFIGAVPSALLLLLENPSQSLIFIIFTIILQQIDGNVIKPRIHSSKTGMSGFWIVFAITVFGGFFGVLGMILGVPIMNVLYGSFKRLSNRNLTKKGLATETAAYEGLEKINPESLEFVYKEDTILKETAETENTDK
jgi:predicted PurR-regulated permease PerM